MSDGFECEYCGKECASEHGLKCHKTRVHDDSGVEKTCENCGETYRIVEHKAEGRKYCTESCFRDAEAAVWRQFVDVTGQYRKSVDQSDYPTNWQSRREKVLERFSRECQACGKSENELAKSLHVHHVLPVYPYPPDMIHNDANLTVLCHDCHLEWEGVFAMPVRVGDVEPGESGELPDGRVSRLSEFDELPLDGESWSLPSYRSERPPAHDGQTEITAW